MFVKQANINMGIVHSLSTKPALYDISRLRYEFLRFLSTANAEKAHFGLVPPLNINILPWKVQNILFVSCRIQNHLGTIQFQY